MQRASAGEVADDAAAIVSGKMLLAVFFSFSLDGFC